MPDQPEYYTKPLEAVLDEFGVDPDQGLSAREVTKRRKQYGPNQLREAKPRSPFRILLDQFKSVVIWILLAAGVLALVFAQWLEAAAILLVVLVNGGIGFVSEWRALRSMEALRRMGRTKTRVRRGGQESEPPVPKLVPGDLVLLEAGDIVPADLRLIEANNLHADESALTGESEAVAKSTEPVDSGAPLAERGNMLYKGTVITEGSAAAVAVATGMNTELGRISQMVEEAEDEATPLEKRLNRLGARLAWLTLAIAVVIGAAGLFAGQPVRLMIETAIALGVAAIPEGLPIIATIALARGMWVLARRQALINRLSAVETLGATQIIFTDKTGTLTENQMTVQRLLTPAGECRFAPDPSGSPAPRIQDEENAFDGDADEALLRHAVRIGVLCNNAALGDADSDGVPDEGHGDPTEEALLWAGVTFGMRRRDVLEAYPEAREVAFDADVMMMATYHETGGQYLVAVKGAPQRVLDVCTTIADGEHGGQPLDDETRRQWLERGEEMAGEGLRMLALADKQVDDTGAEPYEGLRFIGLAGLLDPPHPGVREAIAACQRAGIRVVMLTGDQIRTARAIGRKVGLMGPDDTAWHSTDLGDIEALPPDKRKAVTDAQLFARVSPEQKLHLLSLFQEQGHVVAMTGDGVNDAPALKKANIGVAMGRRGTDAAREAADMVLKDDAFSSIVAAIGQGRVIFSNIRKSAMFMLCTNVAEVLAVALTSLAGVPLPLLPLQILYLNMLTDVFPALALAVGEGRPEVMDAPPRPRGESIITTRHWAAVGIWSALIAACVLAGLGAGMQVLELEEFEAVTISFLTLGFAKLWFVFNLRDPRTPLFRNEVTQNPWIWGALALCAALLLLAVYLPGLSTVLRTRPPGPAGWGVTIGLSLVPAVVGQAYRLVQAIWARTE